MKHLGTVPLATERLVLRRYTPEDAAAMYHNWASDPEVTKYLTWTTHKALSESEAVMAQWVADYKRPDTYLWAIVPRDFGQPIGTISVVEMKESVEAMEIGYCIGRRWWRKGYVAEAMGAVMDFLFREVGVRRICAAHDVENPASGAVMRKCGLRPEGVLRQSDRDNRGIVDSAVYGILRQEYLHPAQEKSCGAVVFVPTSQGPRYVLVQSLEGIWGFPKGHVEAGESEHDTALREIREEVGLRPRLLEGFREADEYPLPGTDRRKEVIYFLAESTDSTLTPQPEELLCARLVTLEEGLALLPYPRSREVLIRAHLFLLGRSRQ